MIARTHERRISITHLGRRLVDGWVKIAYARTIDARREIQPQVVFVIDTITKAESRHKVIQVLSHVRAVTDSIIGSHAGKFITQSCASHPWT